MNKDAITIAELRVLVGHLGEQSPAWWGCHFFGPTAMAYWLERVREKCDTDKPLAIAHDLEHLYVEPEPASKKTRGRKKNTGSSE